MKTNTNEKQLTGAELVAALTQKPEAVVARMTFQEQIALLARVVRGEEKVTEAIGAALLDAMRLQPHEVGAALAHVAEIRRKNTEGRQAWERLQEIDAEMKPLVAEITAKAVEVLGPEWESVQPMPWAIDWAWDRVEVNNAPALVPLAEAITVKMQGRYALSRVAQMLEQQVDVRDLVALADSRREAAQAARSSA